MASRKINISEILERDVLELVLSGKGADGVKWDQTFIVSEPQLETFLAMQDDPDKIVQDSELLLLVLKDQGLTRERIDMMGRKARMLAAKAIMAHFLADPDELRVMPGMDKVDLLYSTGLGLSLASAERTRRTRSSGRSG
jgi:hypothetical protein